MRISTQKNISIIGAGKVGTTLAVMLHRAGWHVVSVISHKKSSARKLARLVRCAHYSDILSDIHTSTDIIIIAAPDEAVSGIACEIATNARLDFSRLTVFHTSGVLTRDVLLPLRKKGAVIFSFHPIQTFPKSTSLADQIGRMRKIPYGFEGDRAALRIAQRIGKELGGEILRIPKEGKILYHIACVLASNYSVALLGVVEKLVKQIGGNIKLRHLEPLVRTSIENAFLKSPEKALTGPIARGSVSTVQSHINELKINNKGLIKLYQYLGMQALELTGGQKSLKPATKRQTRKILKTK